MRKLTFFTVFLLTATASNAADIIVNSAPETLGGYDNLQPYVPPSGYDNPPPLEPPLWDGGYIGVNAGWVRGNFKHPFTAYQYMKGEVAYDINEPLSSKDSSYAAGVQIGYNFAFNNSFLVGLEADFQKTNLKGNFEYALSNNPSWLNVRGTTSVDWYGTVRTRLGYTPSESILIYATAGLAYGKIKTNFEMTDADKPVSYSSSDVKSGYAVGAGAEYAINKKWTIKTEYLHINLGKKDLYENVVFDKGGVIANYTSLGRKVTLNTVRVGLNYKF